MANTLDPNGRMYAPAPPAGDYTGFTVTRLSTGQKLTYNQPFTVAGTPTGPTPSAGLKKLHTIGDSNTAPGEVNQSETWTSRLATKLDSTVWDVSTLGSNQPQLAQGGAATQEILLLLGKDYAGNGSALSQAIKPGTLNVFHALLSTNDAGKDSASTPYMDGDGSSSYANWYGQLDPTPTNYPGIRNNLAEIARLIRATCAAFPNTPCRLLLGISAENGHNPDGPNTTWRYPKQQAIRDYMLANGKNIGWDQVLDVYTDQFIGQSRNDNTAYWKTDHLHWLPPGHERYATISLPVLNSL